MSQDPPPPLDSVPKTALRKRKTKNSSSTQQAGSITPNNIQAPSQPNPQPPVTSANINSNNSNSSQQAIQQNQTSSNQVITDISTLGPLRQRKSKSTPKPAETPQGNPPTTVTDTQSTTNLNSNNSKQQQQQANQPNQTSTDQIITDVSTLGNLRQRKTKPKPSFIEPTETSQATETNPKQAPIETNEIPDIDIMNDSSNDNLNLSSNSSRLGLDIEQDNALSARYMNPNFDLSKIGKNESKQLLNKSISKEYAERFTKDMTAREEQFRKEYVKPKEKANEQLVNSTFLESELNSMIETISKNIQSNTEKFDLNKCNFIGISSTDTLFKPNLSGVAKSYTMNSQEAIDALSGKHELLSIDELKTELGASFLKTPQSSGEQSEDFIAQIKKLFNQSNKQISPTDFVIDLSMQESVNLICQIALFFSTGLRCHSSVLFNRLYNQMNGDSRGRANIVSLQTALLQAKSTVTDITGSYRFTVFYILHLIQLAQCSSLLRYMSGLLTFKKKNYYGDALILDSNLCNQLSEEVEKIECVQIQGGLIRINIPDSVPATSGDRFALRVSGIVDSYLRKTRNWLLQGVEINSEQTKPLADVLKIFIKSFLIQKNGSCLSLDALYEIFELIASLSDQNNSQNNSVLDPCCDHPAYKRFVEIFRGKDVTRHWDTKTKIWVTILNALNEKILPYIILFGVTIPQTKTTMNPAYFRDPVSCLRIAHALLPMKFPAFNIRYEAIKHDVSSLD